MNMNNNLTLSRVVEVNIYTVFRNWIFNYFWESKDLEFSKNKSLEYYFNLPYVDRDITKNKIKELFEYYIIKVKNNPQLIFESEKKRSFGRLSFKKFVEDNGLPFKNKIEFNIFVLRNF